MGRKKADFACKSGRRTFSGRPLEKKTARFPPDVLFRKKAGYLLLGFCLTKRRLR